jgi:hypothetical protein
VIGITSNGKDLSYGRKLGYRRLLSEVAEHWLEADLITLCEMPSIMVSPKHTRQEVISPLAPNDERSQQMVGLEAFEAGIKTLLEMLKGKIVRPEELMNCCEQIEFENYLALSLILSGAVMNNALDVFCEIEHQDVYLGKDPILHLPKVSPKTKERMVGSWLVLSPLASFMINIAVYRAKKSKTLISQGNTQLKKHFNRFLRKSCRALKIPEMDVAHLIMLQQIYLNHHISANVFLAALEQLIPLNPIPEDQVSKLLSNLRGSETAVEILFNETLKDKTEIASPAPVPESPDLEPYFQTYREIKDKLSPILKDYFLGKNLTTCEAQLHTWANQHRDHTEIPYQNTALLLDWILSVNVKSGSKGVYWVSAQRVLMFAPDVSVLEIDENIIKAFMLTNYAAKTLNLSKTSW